MKNKNRRVLRRALSVMLALLMLLTVAPLTVFAEETASYKTGDIVEFGSYPQSEVTDETLKTALSDAAGSTDDWTSYNYYSKGIQGDFMKYTDVEYDGEKYRGVYFTQYRTAYVENSVSTSFQETNGYSLSTVYWYKYEPIEWQVLSYDSTTGESVVLSKSIIDSQHFYRSNNNRQIDGTTVYSNNYEHSDIRTWLNDTFYNTAFGETEKSAIVATELDNSAYSTDYSQYDSNSTTDNVWLLSYSEVLKTEYGFASDKYETETRQATGTAYALSQGLFVYSDNGCTFWGLRSAGNGTYCVCFVDCVGTDNITGNIREAFIGVRPALTVKLPDKSSPVPGKTEYSVGEVVEFGSYPQSEVTDETLKTALADAAGSTDTWTSYGYVSCAWSDDAWNADFEEYGAWAVVANDNMKYIDIVLDGAKYRGVYFTQYRPDDTTTDSGTVSANDSYQDDNGYVTDTVYWFKYEPIEWQVLSFDKKTGDAVVLSKSILDSQQFYRDTANRDPEDGGFTPIFPNNYEHSDIRVWLNAGGMFYDTAFGTADDDKIVVTEIDNSAAESSVAFGSNPTTDKVWLLSYTEVTDEAYGLTEGENRKATGTAYALSQGLNAAASSGNVWRLRTAAGVNYSAIITSSLFVDGDGYSVGTGNSGNTNYTSWGIRPAMKLHLADPVACEHTETRTEKEDVVAATCTAEGSYTEVVICNECGDEISRTAKTIDKISHTVVTSLEDIVNATCTEAGKFTTVKTCSVCKTELSAVVTNTAPLGHDFTAEVMDDDYLISGKTCTERDKYYTSCTRCGLSSKGTEDEATFEGSDVVLGHSFTAETVDAKFLKDEATCTAAAVYYKSCIRCGASSKDTADEATFTSGGALGHDFTAEVMTDDYLISGKTCTERDKYYKSCIRCGLSSKGTEDEATFEGSDVVLGHSFTAEVMTDEYLISGKTCTERDKYYKSCIRCGLSSKGTEYEATFEGSDVVLGHSFTAETVDAKFLKDEATCTEAAVYYKSCIRCGASSKDTADEATFTNGDPLGHSMVKTEAKEETCTVDGNIAYYTCSTCEKIFKDEAGEEEITLDDTVIKAAHLIAQHPASAPDCTHEGNEAWEDCHREGCGYTTYKAIPALGHSFGEWVTVKEPTATEKGLAKRTCSACGTEETKDLDTVSDKDDDSDLSCLERIINLFKKILLAFAAIFGCGCGGSSAGN